MPSGAILADLGALRRGCVALATLAAMANPACASDYYAGKTINFIIGTDFGGGFSIYARAIARHLPRYIPGRPTIVLKNMPGAGGAVASTWLYQMAPRDGTVIASVSPNAILGRLFGDHRMGYEPAKFNYLAGAEQSKRLCVTFQHSHVQTLADALVRRANIGESTDGRPSREYSTLVNEDIGARCG